MNCKFLLLVLVNIIISPLISRSQDVGVLKKMIYDDLLMINSIHNYQIMDTAFVIKYYNNEDSVIQEYNYNSIRDRYRKNVEIVSIDSSGNYIEITARFKNVKLNCYPRINQQNMLFRYLVYNSKKRLYRINGFVSSEIKFLSKDDLFGLRYLSVEKHIQKSLIKAYCKNNNSKISQLLTVSVLEPFNKNIDQTVIIHPVISSPLLFNCKAVE